MAAHGKSMSGALDMIVALLFLLSIAFCAIHMSLKDSQPAPQPVPVATATEAPTATPTVEPTQNPVFDPEYAKTILDTMLADSYSYHSIYGDESGFVLNVSNEDIGLAVELTKRLRQPDLLASWAESKQSFIYVYGNIQDFLKNLGMEKPTLLLNLVNDKNHDDVLLSVYEGVVIYDTLSTE